MFQLAQNDQPVPSKGGLLDVARRSLSSGVDLRVVWNALIRRQSVVFATLAGFLLLAVLYIAVTPARYTATTQIMVDPSDVRVVEGSINPNPQFSDNLLQVESQVRVISSDNVLRRVITDERLDADPEFGGRSGSGLRDLARSVLESFGLMQSSPSVDPVRLALFELHRATTVKRTERTYVVEVSVTTKERDKSMRIANAIARAYVAEQTAAQTILARRATQELTARLAEQRANVRDAEERVENFKARNAIIRANDHLVSEQELNDVNNQLGIARLQTSAAASRVAQIEAAINAGSDPSAISEATQSQTLVNLRAQAAEISSRESAQTSMLGPRHPAIVEIRAQTERLRNLIKEELKRLASTARTDHDRARANEAALTGRLNQLKREVLGTNDAMVTLRELERDVQANRAVYETFLTRSRETRELERLDTKNIRVISQANTPLNRNWPPSNSVIFLIATILGLTGGIGLVLMLEWKAIAATQRPKAIDGPLISGTDMPDAPAARFIAS